MEAIGQPELLKEINRARVFDILKRERVVSRPDLARQTGLSRATIALLADDLLKRGLVREIGLADSTGGRPAVLLEFNPRAALALGARMGDRKWSIVLTDLDAQEVAALDVGITDATPIAAVEALKRGVEAITTGVDSTQLLPAIGLGTPGLVDVRLGVIKTAVDVGWSEVPIKAMAEEALQLEVYVANRSKVGALAEFWYGAGQGVKDLIYIAIGTGIAAGIVHRGELYLGANSSAGELGHVTILPDGPLCPCGNRGCLQQLASEPAIAVRARERLRTTPTGILYELTGARPEWITAEMVFQAAAQGDMLACQIVDEVASYLGIAIANLVNLFNPEIIILGGPVGRLGHVLVEPLKREVQRRAMAYPLSAAQFVASSLSPNADAIGAAVLVLQHARELLF